MWTKTAPTEAGWYWWRKYQHKDYQEPLQVYDNKTAGLIVYVDDEWGHEMARQPSDIGGEWWPTPIQQPES